MMIIRQALFILALVAGCAQAQTAGPAPGEVAFWESVRDSRNPAELQAYLQTFPNGMFAPIARARLAALGARPAPAPSTPKPPAGAAGAPPTAPTAVANSAPTSVTAATRMPQAGDTWTYTLSYPRLRGQWAERSRPSSSYLVKAGGVNGGKIIDQIAVDGGTIGDVIQSREPMVGPQQGISLFSPYLVAFRDLPSRGSVGSVTILDVPCRGTYACEASGRIIGPETIEVPAGKFNAIKVLVTQTWRSSGSASGAANTVGLMGGRTITVWYVPELKRAAKFQSRLTVGDVPAVESNFDLDLLSYQVK